MKPILAVHARTAISRRTFLKQAGAAGTAALLAACAAPATSPANVGQSGEVAAGASQESVTITMWGGAFLMTSNQELWDGSEYARQHENITFVTTPMPYAEYSQKMALAISAGEGDPDVMLVHYPFIRDFVGKGVLVDITDRVEQDQFNPDVFASVVDDGSIYGVPYAVAPFVNYYREDVLSELNLEPPTNIDDYFMVGNTIKQETGKDWTFIDKATGNVALFQSFVLMLNGDVFSPEGEVVLDTEAGKGVEAAELLLKISDSGFAVPLNSESPEGFEVVKQGQVAGNLTNFAWIHRMQDAIVAEDEVFGKFRISFPPELMPGGPVATSQNGSYLLINKLSEHPDAAWDVVAFFAQSVEGVRALADQFLVMGGYKPGLQDIVANSEGWPLVGGQRVQALLAELTLRDDLNVITMHPNLGEAQTFMDEAFVRMLAHEISPADAIAEASERIRNIDK